MGPTGHIWGQEIKSKWKWKDWKEGRKCSEIPVIPSEAGRYNLKEIFNEENANGLLLKKHSTQWLREVHVVLYINKEAAYIWMLLIAQRSKVQFP